MSTTDRIQPQDKPILVFTQGDPSGIGPEILIKVASDPWLPERCRPLLIIEKAALEALWVVSPDMDRTRFRVIDRSSIEADLWSDPDAPVPVVDPGIVSASEGRVVYFGKPSADDARGALAALDFGIELVTAGTETWGCGHALVTAPLNKAEIATHVDRSFRGHTDYLAEKAGLTHYGRDYLMAFLAPSLKVALLSTHISLVEAIEQVKEEKVLDALRCMAKHSEGRIVVAGLDPHVGEGGLIGTRDDEQVRPAVHRAQREGIDVSGPESADSLFARVQRGAYDWVLALYHDQGLIGLKTAAFGDATNWTLGLPYLRTSVDHGTAYDIAGLNRADASSLRAVVETTLELCAE